MAARSPKEIRLALERRLYDVLHPARIRMAQRNVPFDHHRASLWARAVVRLGRPATLEKGINALGSRPGVLIVQLFQLPGRDIGEVEDICAQIEKAFRLQSIDGVFCQEPATEDVGRDQEEAWHQCNVTVPFWTWVGQ